MRLFRLLLVMSAIALLCSASFAAMQIAPTSDGAYYYVNGNPDSVGSLSDEIINSFYYVDLSVSHAEAIIVFSISNLWGQTLQPGQATFNFKAMYNGELDTYHVSSDYGPTVNVNYGRDWSRELISALPDGYGSRYTWFSFDVTQQLQQDINSHHSYSAFIVKTFDKSTNWGQGTNAYIYASENGEGPYLNIVPEPTSILAMICGLSGTGGMILRRKIR